MFDYSRFSSPDREGATRPMTHSVPDDMDAFFNHLADCGYAGAVVNVPFGDGFTDNPDNLVKFGKIIEKMKERGLAYWIYDEPGYPSGQAGGRTLKGHPEWQTKGLYMHRRATYEPTDVHYRLDDESEKIVFASVYPMETPGLNQSFVQFDKMRAVPFTRKTVKCHLNEKEVLYIFCVKNAHEGTQSTHNTCSFRRNVNLMCKQAIRRYIDIAFEPIARALPDAYPQAGNVFTDEPSLMTHYVRNYEAWNYAMHPWVDGFFRRYEKEYGEPIYKDLPLLFEGLTTDEAGGLHNRAYAVRVRFFRLIGRLCAENYSGQLASWCKAHGTGFSGHYLAEENIRSHVLFYGNYIEVVKHASYPGVDILNCNPDSYNPNTTKFAQAVARKNHTDGIMVEICPFFDVERFNRAPADNILAILPMLALDGVRTFNTYYEPGLRGQFDTADSVAKTFNRTAARLNCMLKGRMNDCHTLVYYPIEDAQAKTKPSLCEAWSSFCVDTDERLNIVKDALYRNGLDFFYADDEDLEKASRSKTVGVRLYGLPVKRVLIPDITVMNERALRVLKTLQARGVDVCFIGRRVPMISETAEDASRYTASIPVKDMADVVREMREEDDTVACVPNDGTVHIGRYRDGRERLYLIANVGDEERELTATRAGRLLWLVSGEEWEISANTRFTIPPKRSVFLLCR